MSDTTFPRDAVVMTPHFDDGGITTDPQALCDDLAAALNTWMVGANTRQVKVTAYDAQGTPPVYPQGEAILNTGMQTDASCPREVALCLSFYSERNIPRNRGRLYIPAWFLPLGANGALVRPNPSSMVRAGELAPILEQLGGPDVDWVVYSRTDDVARPVTNWFVDDEWDTVRSRGLRATTRQEGSTSEA
jgi:hypothetical protein